MFGGRGGNIGGGRRECVLIGGVVVTVVKDWMDGEPIPQGLDHFCYIQTRIMLSVATTLLMATWGRERRRLWQKFIALQKGKKL